MNLINTLKEHKVIPILTILDEKKEVEKAQEQRLKVVKRSRGCPSLERISTT